MVGDYFHGDFNYTVGYGVTTRGSEVGAARHDAVPDEVAVATGETCAGTNKPTAEVVVRSALCIRLQNLARKSWIDVNLPSF